MYPLGLSAGVRAEKYETEQYKPKEEVAKTTTGHSTASGSFCVFIYLQQPHWAHGYIIIERNSKLHLKMFKRKG